MTAALVSFFLTFQLSACITSGSATRERRSRLPHPDRRGMRAEPPLSVARCVFLYILDLFLMFMNSSGHPALRTSPKQTTPKAGELSFFPLHTAWSFPPLPQEALAPFFFFFDGVLRAATVRRAWLKRSRCSPPNQGFSYTANLFIHPATDNAEPTIFNFFITCFLFFFSHPRPHHGGVSPAMGFL